MIKKMAEAKFKKAGGNGKKNDYHHEVEHCDGSDRSPCGDHDEQSGALHQMPGPLWTKHGQASAVDD